MPGVARRTAVNSALCFFTLTLTLFAGVTSRACPVGEICYDCSGKTSRVREGRDTSGPEHKVSIHCSYPCECDHHPQTPPKCRENSQSHIVDGCGCCTTCARPLGDDCDTINKCDENRGIICDWGPDVDYDKADRERLTGKCVAKHGKTCQLTFPNGTVLVMRDRSTTTYDTCSTLCTCQNGVVTCSNLCPQEKQRPNCKNATLVRVKSLTSKEEICCREWVCPNMDRMQGDSPAPAIPTPKPTRRVTRNCRIRTTDWSPCSKSCDVGESYRVTNDNAKCEERKEFRLCMLRPCGHQDVFIDGHCRPTTRVRAPISIQWRGCTSKLRKPKFCSTCKVDRCCTPNVDKTITMDFHCPQTNTTVTKNYMWIKNCKCHRNCDSYWSEDRLWK